MTNGPSPPWLPTRLEPKRKGLYKRVPCQCSKCYCEDTTVAYILICATCKRHNPRSKVLNDASFDHQARRIEAKAQLHDVKLDEFELKVLEEICKTGRAHSSVALTSDLYYTTEDIQKTRPLEWFAVESLLEDLNKQGLVTYRLGEHDLFVHIRPTQAAYAMLHIERRWLAFVGRGWHARQEHAVHPGDTTDFRSYEQQSEGGPIIREDFIDHCVSCGHLSIHRVQLIEMYGSDEL